MIGGGVERGGQDVRESNVNGFNDVVYGKKFKGNIKWKYNRDNIMEEEILGEEDSYMVPEKKWDARDVSEYTGKGKATERVFENSEKQEEMEDKGGLVGGVGCGWG